MEERLLYCLECFVGVLPQPACTRIWGCIYCAGVPQVSSESRTLEDEGNERMEEELIVMQLDFVKDYFMNLFELWSLNVIVTDLGTFREDEGITTDLAQAIKLRIISLV